MNAELYYDFYVTCPFKTEISVFLGKNVKKH